MNPALSRHLQQLGLERSPFPPTPDAASYYQTSVLESELVEAAHALRTRAGFVLLTGEVGTGKSTFLRRLLGQLESDGMVVSLVFNTFLQGDDLLAAVLRDFGLKPHGNAATDIEVLNRFLINRWQDRTTCVLIIDDAQNLSLASLELVRLLTSLETGQEKLLQIVLSGQPELRDNLDMPQIRQLTSRICKHVRLDPLSHEQTREYVNFRLRAAGAGERIRVDAKAVTALHRASNGNPRRIHLIMDRCLYGLYAQPSEQRLINADLVNRAAAQAGAQAARSPTAAYRYALTAGISLAACLGIAGLVAGSVESRADSRNGPPTTTGSNAAVAQVSAPVASDTTACDQNAVTGALRSDWVAAAAAEHLRQLPNTCLIQHGERWQLLWSPDAASTRFLDPSQVGSASQALQRRLFELGHYDGAIDGRYGRLTQRALARFQQRYALPATGNPDPLTLLLLAAPAPVTSHSSSLPDSLSHGNG